MRQRGEVYECACLFFYAVELCHQQGERQRDGQGLGNPKCPCGKSPDRELAETSDELGREQQVGLLSERGGRA